MGGGPVLEKALLAHSLAEGKAPFVVEEIEAQIIEINLMQL